MKTDHETAQSDASDDIPLATAEIIVSQHKGE
jgi:hypothetical protein